ncbi:MAG: hypothetical protein KDJ16_07850 [Hyphomicrobiales bacterium]|nr:hypothetical protein [Hyphomicrobiales bacterium]
MRKLLIGALLIAAALFTMPATMVLADGYGDPFGRGQNCQNQVISEDDSTNMSVARVPEVSSNTVAFTTFPSEVAVSCGSDEWCCKHDIGGTGACTKCCAK